MRVVEEAVGSQAPRRPWERLVVETACAGTPCGALSSAAHSAHDHPPWGGVCQQQFAPPHVRRARFSGGASPPRTRSKPQRRGRRPSAPGGAACALLSTKKARPDPAPVHPSGLTTPSQARAAFPTDGHHPSNAPARCHPTPPLARSQPHRRPRLAPNPTRGRVQVIAEEDADAHLLAQIVYCSRCACACDRTGRVARQRAFSSKGRATSAQR